MLDKKLPFVLGMECTGTVTAVGTETDLAVVKYIFKISTY